ncbi:MAG: CcoQ/FixQ family Cbb3-type cytochrome c oxidase assembly chaperone [Crocinitomicaceae bacterium]|jgi:cytochrome c oxidase cbb3-type subunit 4|nr:CcoQ/FixQ family Cbb3-type cytochrome c oxidase assembly chaperone [Crocinitomicaceae bacterium]
MLRFIKHNLTTIDGVSIFPMISLLIFVLFFALVLTRTYRMSKASVNELSGIPLEDEVEMNQENKIDIL